ncbi:MAG: LacI family DNA-binding transcriptional regulator [Paracoccaceae bacterium]
MNNRVTIIDVSNIAGVSTATVSRTLHNPNVVTAKTRKAVMNAVHQTGYTQNTAAQNLRQQRANAILVLVPDISNTFFSEILSGIEHVASQANLTTLIADTLNDAHRTENFTRYLFNGRADGALLLNGYLPDSIVETIRNSPQNHPAIVSVSEALDDQIVPHIGIDNIQATQMAVEHLLAKGHRFITHLSGPAGNILTSDRIKGYRNAMVASGLNDSDQHLIQGDFSIASGEAAANDIIAMERRPDAVFCSNDAMAIGLISALVNRGVAVPNDIAVMGFDDIEFARTCIPPLTTIHQPRRRIGEMAAKTLLAQLGIGDFEMPDTSSLQATLVERDSA